MSEYKNEGIETNLSKNLMREIITVYKSILNNPDVFECFSRIKSYNMELFDHSINVAFLSLFIGHHFNISDSECFELCIAALLHDYGKIFISKNILEKPGPLTKEERETVELHSMLGYIHLSQQTSLPQNVLIGVLDHHEKMDGSGYGLKKESNSICRYAKIISVADVYDAMISDRVYRKRLNPDVVKEYLCDNAGNHFDAELIKHFVMFPACKIEKMEYFIRNKLF